MNPCIFLQPTSAFAVYERIPRSITDEFPRFKISIDWNCHYTRKIIVQAMRRRKWCKSIENYDTEDKSSGAQALFLVFADFENIVWQDIMCGEVGASSYLVRKGLSRKAQFALQIKKYLSKQPASILKKAIPYTLIIETWNAFENMKLDLGGGIMTEFKLPNVQRAPLRQRLQWILNDVKDTFDEKRQEMPLWILKPSVANKGVDISMVQSWDDVIDALEETEDMREWVLQQYISRPLLVSMGHKFHFRVYVLCVGALSVFVFDEILMLLAAHRYKPTNMKDMLSHLTNTARAAEDVDFDEMKFVKLMKDLPDILCSEYGDRFPTKTFAALAVDKLRSQIHDITAELFAAYENEYSVFCPMQHCFELYGLDFVVDTDMNAYLLEVNPGPDFKQTGDRLQGVIEDLWEHVFRLVVDLNLLFRGEDDDPAGMRKLFKDLAPDFTLVYSKRWSVASMKGGFTMR